MLILNGNEEDLEVMRAKMEKRKLEAKKCKEKKPKIKIEEQLNEDKLETKSKPEVMSSVSYHIEQFRFT